MELWSLILARRCVEGDDEPDEARVLESLLRSRGPRSDPPLGFVSRDHPEPLAKVLAGDIPGVPVPVRLFGIADLIRRPPRYLTLAGSAGREIVMVGVYGQDEVGESSLLIVNGTIDSEPGHGRRFIDLRAGGELLPATMTVDDAAIAALTLESIAGRSEGVTAEFSWPDRIRPASVLWCGSLDSTGSAETVESLILIGMVAGSRISLASRTPGRSALGMNHDLVVVWMPGLNERESELAEALSRQGVPAVRLEQEDPAAAIEALRFLLHEKALSCFEQLSNALPAAAKRPPETQEPPVQHLDSVHSMERAETRSIDREELYRGLGDRRTRAPRATVGMSAQVGSPVCIGTQLGKPGSHDDKDVLLVQTPSTGPLIVVVTRPGKKPMMVLTVWNPTTPENSANWRTDLLGPTQKGAYSVPETIWAIPPPSVPG